MRTFKQNQSQKQASSSLARSNQARSGPNHHPSPMLHLQRAIGNQAGLRLQQAPAHTEIQPGLTVDAPEDIGAQETDRVADQVTYAGGAVLQRTCACGGTPGEDGECAECRAKRLQGRPVLQPKLTVGAANDEYEQEADRVAEQVLAAPAHSVISGAAPRIQRYTGQATGETALAPASVDRVLASPGQPLDPALQQDMGQRFGYDFSQVRVHSDPAAEQSAREVNALAYTVGTNIVFGTGRFAPGTHAGRRLIAHELTHVVQQSGSGVREVQRYEECGDPKDCPPREPDEVRAAQADPMIVAGVSAPNGVLVANFAIGSGRIKTDLATNPTFTEYTRQMAARPQTRLEILGLSDCEGSETTNMPLRAGRATALQDVLPANVRPQLTSVAAAPSNDCMESNQTARGRTLNRSAFLHETSDVYTFEEQAVTAIPGALLGVTSPASEFFVRTTPNGERVGMLALQEMPVEIIRAHGTRIDNLWYEVRFRPDDFEIVRQHYAEYMRPQVPQLQALEQQQSRLPEILEQFEGDPAIQQRIDQVTEDIDTIRAHQARLAKPYSGTTVWVGQAAFSQVAMHYHEILQLIDAFDKEYASEPLRDRLTRLRQIGEDASLQGDATVGRGAHIPGRITQSERPVDTFHWQLFMEAKQVIMPNMEVIDLHHFILGLDALALRPSEQSTNRPIYDPLVGLFSVDVGESFSATTWSGDVGAAVTEYVMHSSSDWEQANTSEDNQQRLDFYFWSRAPEMDLLADIDAWGAFRQLPTTTQEPSRFTSLREIIVEQYGGELQTAEEYEQHVQIGRSAGIIQFLCHYGFTSPTNLSGQSSAVWRVQDQVLTFARAWHKLRISQDVRSGELTSIGQFTSAETDDRLNDTSKEMTLIYLDWLKSQAQQYGIRSLACD